MASNNSQDLDTKSLARGYWWLSHQQALQRYMVIVLWVLIGLFTLWALWGYVRYAYSYRDWTVSMARGLTADVDWSAIHAGSKPQPLTVGQPTLFARGNGVYDFAAPVVNPNPDWMVDSMTYNFVVGDQALPPDSIFILPGERMFLTHFDYQAEGLVTGTGTVSTGEIHWRRIRIPAVTSWIFIEPPTYHAKQIITENGRERGIPARVTWRVMNGSTLNFREVPWQIAIYAGDRLVSLVEYTATNMLFLEERDFDVVIFDPLPVVTKVEVFPVVNVFDESNTYVTSGEGTAPTR